MTTGAYLVVLGGVLLIVGVAVALVLSRLKALAATQAPDPGPSLQLLQQQIDALRAEVPQSLASQVGLLDQRIAETTRTVGDRLDASGRLMGDRLESVAKTVAGLNQQVGQMQQASQRIFEVGRSISGLHEILRSPKIRGGLGELLLEDLLAQILPRDAFVLQHRFRSGAIVDATIRVGDHLVPVDAKFPLENFLKLRRAEEEAEKKAHRKTFLNDVRKHVDAIAEKYIRPDEGTFDFALLYIPAENVYYEAIVRDEASDETGAARLYEHALERRVIPVSPNSFYAYLQVIVLGLRGMRIEDTARQIVDGLARIGGELERYGETLDLVGKHLTNAARNQEIASRQYEKLRNGFEMLRSSGQSTGALPPSVDGGTEGAVEPGAGAQPDRSGAAGPAPGPLPAETGRRSDS